MAPVEIYLQYNYVNNIRLRVVKLGWHDEFKSTDSIMLLY